MNEDMCVVLRAPTAAQGVALAHRLAARSMAAEDIGADGLFMITTDVRDGIVVQTVMFEDRQAARRFRALVLRERPGLLAA